jgi:hypothetical protein
LSDEEIADLRRWINEGAVWPATSATQNTSVIKPEHNASGNKNTLSRRDGADLTPHL